MPKYKIMSIYEAAGPFLSIALDGKLVRRPTTDQKILIHKPDGSTILATQFRFEPPSDRHSAHTETNIVFIRELAPSDIPEGSELSIVEAK